MSARFTVGCIGAGYFSQFHYEAWTRINGAMPVAAVDADLSKAQATGLQAFDDAGAMLAAVQPDIVDIITPPPTHLAMIRLAIEQGAKAVICQKPFCESIAQAKEAVAFAKAADVPLIVHENFRFQPWYRAIKAQIASGAIGQVQQISFRLRPGDGQGADAYLSRQPYFQKMKRFLIHETAVHWVDVFRYLLGEPEAVFADLRQMNPSIAGEDAGTVLFRYADGVRACFDGNRLLDHRAANTRCTMGEGVFEGTRGSLSLWGDGSVTHRAFGALDAVQVAPPFDGHSFGGDCVHALQAHVVAGLARAQDFENTAESYLQVLKAEATIYASADAGAWVKV